MKTYIQSDRGTSRYIVFWAQEIYCREVFERIVKYYCRSSTHYEVTFVLGHGSRFLTLSVDCLLLSSNQDEFIDTMLDNLHKQNVTGVRTKCKDEAIQIEQEIIKAYEWAILKA